MKRIVSLILALMMGLGLMAFPAMAEDTLDVTSLYKAKDVDDSWSEDATVITLQDTTASVSGSGAVVDGNTVTITQEGEYVLAGTLQGQIVIETADTEKVHLILNGVTMNGTSGPAIYEKCSDKLIVTLAESTVNTLTDSTSIQDGEDTIAAALYAEDDLSINGKGTLVIQGNAGNGIHSKADLVIADGDIQVTAANDGIKGRNSVLVLSGSITIHSEGDGLVSTRDDKEGKGYVVIAGGSLSITTGSGAGEVVQTASSRMRRGGWGMQTQTASTVDTPSVKGIKAATTLTVCGGTLDINAEDDALHAVNVTVSGGSLTIRTGDDGIHGDTAVSILGGVIDILQCNEGVEGENVAISGGVTSIVCADDGVNATTADSSGSWNREASDGSLMTISGGELYITAGSDGLDSNGNIVITGGVIGVYAATTMGEGTVDYNGSSTMSGGTLILATNGNMGGNLISGTALMSVQASGQAGSEISLTDAAGNLLGSFTPGSSYSTVIVGSSSLASGDSCAVTVAGQTVYSGALTGTTYTAGDGFGGQFGGMGGQFGGGRGGMGGRGGRGGW